MGSADWCRGLLSVYELVKTFYFSPSYRDDIYFRGSYKMVKDVTIILLTKCTARK
jgi:hypothetical protein